MSELAQYRGTGKRKTSVARVILRPGDDRVGVAAAFRYNPPPADA